MAETKDIISDITSKIDDFETEHRDLYEQMEANDDLYNNEDYDLDGESSVVTTNDPRAFIDSILARIDTAKIIIKVTSPGNKHDKDTKIEHLNYGILSLADKNLRRKIVTGGRSVQSALGHYAARYGYVCARVLLTKKKNEIIPFITPINPRWFYYGLGDDGFEWVATKYWRDSDSIYAEYKVEVDGFTPVIDYWEKKTKKNIIVVGSKTIEQTHKLSRVPFVFLPVGTSPLIYSDDDKANNIPSWGVDAFARSRKLYEVERKTLSIWLNLIEKSHKPSYFVFAPGAQMKLERTPWGTGELLTLPAETKVQAVEPPDIANTAPAFYNIIQQKIQKGDFSQVEYGLISGADYPSGKTLNLLNNGTAKVVQPILDTLGACYEDICEMITEQYREQGIKTNFKGYDSKGQLYYDDIKPTDCDKPWDIEVTLESISPEEDMQNIAKAQMLHNMGKAEEYIDEEILKMRDPEKPRRQRLLQMAESNPIIMLVEQIKAATVEGRNDMLPVLQKQLGDMLKQMRMAEQQAMQGAQPGPAQVAPPASDGQQSISAPQMPLPTAGGI